jgi:signal transduction histidine kinase/ligand-binding sensor domain-containing protein/DNA-binding response OmpR family regulator
MQPVFRLLLGLVIFAGVNIPDQATANQDTDLFAPDVDLVFEHITVDDGLPENSVRAILQDSSGFLWFGTMNGLVRYDGYDLVVFAPSQDDTTSFGGRTVLALHEDVAGDIWIGTYLRGLWKYETRLGTFRPIDLGQASGVRPEADLVNAIAEDDQGRLWVGMQYGLVSVDLATEEVTWHDKLTEDLGPNGQALPVIAIMVDKKGRIWCGTDKNGVAIYTPDTGDVRWLKHNPDRPQSLPSSIAYDIAQSADGKIWVATTNGLALWQESTGEFIVLRPASETGPSGRNVLVRIEPDEKGLLWIGSAAGLYVFDPLTLQFRLFSHDRDDPTSPVNGPVLSLLFDRSGILWAGSWHAGLNKVNPHGGGFHVQQFTLGEGNGGGTAVESILEDSGGGLWAGVSDMPRGWGRGALFHRESPGSPFEQIPHEAPGIELTSVLQLTEGRDGVIWVGTFSGLWKVADRTLIQAPFGEGEVRTIFESMNIKPFLVDNTGMVWLGTMGHGLFRLDPDSGEVHRFQHNILDPHSIGSDEITSAFQDRSGRIWVGTDSRGLNLFRSEDLGFQRFFSPEQGLETVSDIIESPQGDLWLSSFSGLVRFDPSTGTTEIINRAQGLPNDQVVSILEDGQGRYWVSTGFGMARVDPATRGIRAFDTLDGLPDNDTMFAGQRTRDGLMHFGGRTGLVTFDPNLFVSSTYQPEVVLTGIALSDTLLTVGENSPLEKLPHHISELVLHHDQNDLSLGFAALDFGRPDQIQYRYILEGHDDNWRTPVAQRRASYTNLKPDTYVFRVRGTNRDGVWSSHEVELTIRIMPPWWRTWWAYTLYILAIGLLVTGIIRQLVQRERLRAKIELQRTEAAQLQELDRLKQKFLTNITHEFRTPLTMIKAPLLRLQSEQGESPDGRIATMIRNTDRLEHLIDQLLDLSRLEAGRLPLHWRQEDCMSFLREFVSGFQALTTQRSLSLIVTIPDDSAVVWFDSDVLEKLVGNLMSNAVKYTPKGGRVEARVHLGEEIVEVPVPKIGRARAARVLAPSRSLVVAIENSGAYIPPHEQKRVFDRFYQASGTDGSGVGLALVKELIDWLGGTIVLDSSQETGTCFTATLPIFLHHPEHGPDYQASDEPAVGGRTDEEGDELDAVFDEAKILVVEDNTDLRNFISEDFSPQYRMLAAEDGQAGLDLAIEETPDLILSDVMMPVMDGFAMTKRLKEDERTSHIPIILMTAKSEVEDRHTGLRLGADDYVAKPFDVEDLRLRIQNLIDQRRKVAEIYERKIAMLSPEAMPVDSADERFVVQLREVIDSNLDDPDFKIDSLCREVGMSRSQLHRKLKAVIGKSTSDFVRSHRIRRAANLFDGGYGNVTEVAYAVGFKNLSYFSKSFKEVYGVQPSEYLRSGDEGVETD